MLLYGYQSITLAIVYRFKMIFECLLGIVFNGKSLIRNKFQRLLTSIDKVEQRSAFYMLREEDNQSVS